MHTHMNARLFSGIGLIGAALLMGIPARTAHAQGSLTPPGAPGPTMKTLAQVEPRIPVDPTALVLSQPGSYYLTTNLAAAVSIQTNNITLDLMGFAIAPASGSALIMSGSRTNVTVRNGILSAPIGNGIDFSTSSHHANILLEDLQVGRCQNYGIIVGGGAIVRDCMVSGAGLAGISGGSATEIRNCRITGNGAGLRLTGTNGWVEGNTVFGNATNYLFTAGNRLNLLLSEIPQVLAWPCSVRLAGTLIGTSTATNGITVLADDVTIDLGGHALVGPGAASKHGIAQDPERRNLRVYNGSVAGWRGTLAAGISAIGYGAMVSDVRAATNTIGIWTGDGSLIERCVAHNNLDDGIYAGSGCVVRNCAAIKNGDVGIVVYRESVIADCSAAENFNGGISAGYHSRVGGCAVNSNTGIGILGAIGCHIRDCNANYNRNDGIQVESDSLIIDNQCHNNGSGDDGAGIKSTGDDNRIEGNAASGNDWGILVTGSSNLVVRNSASGNGVNWQIAADNKVGPIVIAPNSAAISGNSGGSGVGSTDPWANITF